MKVHEYQAKDIFRKYDIPTPKEKMCTNINDVSAAADEIGIPCVIKAQVMVGGRGKAGGIKVAKNKNEVREHAEKILGMDIKGLQVKKVLVSEAVDIASEAYLGIINDRTAKKTVVMACKEGGVEIEVSDKYVIKPKPHFLVVAHYQGFYWHSLSRAFANGFNPGTGSI